MRTRIKASFMKHPNCSLPSRPASLDLSLSPLPHTAPWERFQGNCQRGKFNNGVKKSKSTIHIHMFMFVVGVPTQVPIQWDVGIGSMVFNLMENETSKFEKSAQFMMKIFPICNVLLTAANAIFA